MLDFDEAEKLAVSVFGFAGGLLVYLGRKGKKEEESEDEANLSFIQEQFTKVETERDAANKERDAANKEREEVGKKAFENIVTLLEIIKRLGYMLSISDSSRAETNKREILALIKHRNFDMKETLTAELTDMFAMQGQEKDK